MDVLKLGKTDRNEGDSGALEQLNYLDLGDGFTKAYICKNLLSFTLKINKEKKKDKRKARHAGNTETPGVKCRICPESYQAFKRNSSFLKVPTSPPWSCHSLAEYT